MNKTANYRKFYKVVAVLFLTALWVIVPFLLNDSIEAEEFLSDTRIEASMSGSGINGVAPTGYAEYRLDDDGRRRLKAEVFSINLASGMILDVFINNSLTGQLSINSFGYGQLDIDTNDGQNVPVISNGMPVQVRQQNNIVVAGTFGIVNPTPSPSPSGSPTGSPSPSPSGSPSPSPTGSPSPSPSPTGSPSPSPTGSPSPSPTGSPSPSPSPSPGGGDIFAGLSGPTIGGVLPRGFAQYEIHSSRTELEIRIRQINLPGGTSFNVSVNNVSVGQMSLDSDGESRLRLRSDRGQNVPVIRGGEPITIQNGGMTILSGTFAGTSPSPSPTPTGSPSPSPSPSPSQGRYFEAHLNGNISNARGEVKIFLNNTENQATITGEFHDLSSSQTTAGIQVDLGDVTTVHNLGTIGGTNGNFQSATIAMNAAQVQQLRAGLWFATIASTNNPGGEVSGNLLQHSDRADFDGDGSNDLSVFRPSSSTWFAQNSLGFTSEVFGSASDKVVSADYDGDGRTDTAVFKNVNGSGVWEIKNSSDGSVFSTPFGLASDDAVRGDFDGDGLNDLAVFRPSTGVWYIRKSNNTGFIIVQFGLNGDKAIPTDFDGDGKDDIAIFRPGEGNWYWLRSSNGQFEAAHFGTNGDIPIGGDFDGDGKADLSVYRPSNGGWYIFRSLDQTYDIRQFGVSEDVPVAGNYDNDDKTDLAVFRPSTGVWYIWRSIDNTFDFRQFGMSGDVPTIAR